MKTILFSLLITLNILAQYVTPNTGVVWNMDSLVFNSGGTVGGFYPNYFITGLITISVNDRIIIPPNSNLNFTALTAGFEVNGALTAIGKPDSTIIFTSFNQDSTGAYEGLRFNDSSVDSLCIIKFARIEYAKYAMRCINASPTLENSYVFKCTRGANLSGSNIIIRNNIIERSYEYGITMTLGSNPLIEGNTIANNNTKNTSAMNQISIGLQGNNSPIIKNNIIYGSIYEKTGGISLWVSGSTSFSNALIEGNIIYNNSFGITLYSTSNGVINAIVRNNKIYNNKINPDVMTSGSGINVNGSSFNTPIIFNNEIYGNHWGITIQNGTTVQAGPNPNIGNLNNTDTTDDGKNKIYNNIQGAQVYDLYNNCTNDIYAQNNDWGIYDSLSIENHIYHKNDNPLHGNVFFMPFLIPDDIPVELSSFMAEVKGNTILLKWITETEANNYGFEIQHSLNNSSWENIGFIQGVGNSTFRTEYEFEVVKPLIGKNIFRLKQIDFNGTVNYSNSVEVLFYDNLDFNLSQNFPNPFNPITKIKFSVPNNVETNHTSTFQQAQGIANSVTGTSLQIYDVLGNEIATLVNEYKSPGNYEVLWDASEYPSGIYYYQLRIGNYSEVKKMVLMK